MLQHCGFTLIEILISLLLLSLALLGLNGILLLSLHHTQASHQFAVANQQLMAMTERLRALGVHEGLEEQLTYWNTQNKQLLMQSSGMVEGNYPSYTVTLCWGKRPDCLLAKLII